MGHNRVETDMANVTTITTHGNLKDNQTHAHWAAVLRHDWIAATAGLGGCGRRSRWRALLLRC
eukprot:2713656-Lingulodinium_polyedra.AAC.1